MDQLSLLLCTPKYNLFVLVQPAVKAAVVVPIERVL